MDISILNQIKPYLKDKEAYIVGGYVRDFLLNKKSYDIDIVVNIDNVKEFVENISNKIGAHFVPLHEDFEIYRIVLNDKLTSLDFAKLEGKNIDEDLARRDFSINAICYDINNDKIIDNYSGINDLKNKKIKLISEKNLIDDPLRLMRAFRFASVLGFEIDEDTLTLIKKHSDKILIPAKERLIYEFVKMFGGNKVDEILLKMDNCNLINLIFPYFENIKKIPPNSHHHLDLFHHLVESVKQLELVVDNSSDEIKKYLDQTMGSDTHFAYLKLATFLHDYGKPSTWAVEPETGRHRFIGHDNVGAEMIKPVLNDWKFSKKQIEYISRMIKYHIYPAQLASSNDVTDKAKLRFFNKLKDEVIDVILLAHSDRKSALGADITEDMLEQNEKGLNELLDGYFVERERLKELPVLLNGYEIMEILNITEGVKLGKIIKTLNKAQVEKHVSTKNEAIEFVKTINKNLE